MSGTIIVTGAIISTTLPESNGSDASIGEQVTMQWTVRFPEATTFSAIFTVQLPTGASQGSYIIEVFSRGAENSIDPYLSIYLIYLIYKISSLIGS